MPAPAVSQAELQRVHRALHIAVPLDQASPLILATLAVVARCWRTKGKAARPAAPAVKPRARPLSIPEKQLPIDLKRRAAGDTDE